MLRKYFSIISLCLVSELIAQDMSSLEDDCCIDEPQEAFFEIRHREPNGIGYSRGYSSVDAFFTPSMDENFHPFLDARGHIFNDGKFASNVGLGMRYLPDLDCVSYGMNVFWDYSHAKHKSFNQIGVGLELLFPRWDFHLNGYIPVSETKKRYRKGFSKFAGNSAIFFRKYELAMSGGDFTIGYLFAERNWHIAASGYYFGGNFGKHAGGGLLKLKTFLNDYITVEGQVSYDNLFKWIGQGELGLRVPLGREITTCPMLSACCNVLGLEKQLSLPPDRFEIIVSTTHKKKAKAHDPITGAPLRFIFVNNTSSSNGTFESPFPTLAQAQAAANPGDIIYVFPGDGSTTGMDQGITLQDQQKLIGSSFPLPVSTPFGLFTIPPQTTSSPFITGPSSVVNLANDNQVSGFNIIGSNAIFGTNITNAAVSFNTFDSLTITGEGIFNVTNNAITSMFLINSNNANYTIDSNIFAGAFSIVSITSIGGVANMLVNNNTGGVGLLVLGYGASSGMIVYNNNRLDCFGSNAPLITSNASSVYSFFAKGNHINAIGGGNTFAISPTDSIVNVRMSDNVVTGNPFSAYLFAQGGTGVINVASPDSALTGFETINAGTPNIISGNVVFVPY